MTEQQPALSPGRSLGARANAGFEVSYRRDPYWSGARHRENFKVAGAGRVRARQAGGALLARAAGGWSRLVVGNEKDFAEILEPLGTSVIVTSSVTATRELDARCGSDRVFIDLSVPKICGAAFLEKLADLKLALVARAVLVIGDTRRGPTMFLDGAAKTPVQKPLCLTDVRAVLARQLTIQAR